MHVYINEFDWIGQRMHKFLRYQRFCPWLHVKRSCASKAKSSSGWGPTIACMKAAGVTHFTNFNADRFHCLIRRPRWDKELPHPLYHVHQIEAYGCGRPNLIKSSNLIIMKLKYDPVANEKGAKTWGWNRSGLIRLGWVKTLPGKTFIWSQ